MLLSDGGRERDREGEGERAIISEKGAGQNDAAEGHGLGR